MISEIGVSNWQQSGDPPIDKAYPRKVGKVQLLGQDGPIQFTHDTDGLNVDLPTQKTGDHAFCLKILPA